jgi:ferredoxin
MPYKITIDRTLCMGDGTCTVIAPNTFELDSEGKSTVKNPTGDPDEKILEAVKACPVKAMSLKDEHDKQVYP